MQIRKLIIFLTFTSTFSTLYFFYGISRTHNKCCSINHCHTCSRSFSQTPFSDFDQNTHNLLLYTFQRSTRRQTLFYIFWNFANVKQNQHKQILAPVVFLVEFCITTFSFNTLFSFANFEIKNISFWKHFIGTIFIHHQLVYFSSKNSFWTTICKSPLLVVFK